MLDHYSLGNNYIKRVVESGCTPIGIAPADNWINEDVLDLCDGFLVQGGAEFYPYHFQVIHHAITKGKKYLGICLGQQLIYVYFKLKKIVEETGYDGNLVTAMCNSYEYLTKEDPNFSFQNPVENHRNEFPKRGNEAVAKHKVNIIKDTLLYKVLESESIDVCSFHKKCTPPNQNLVAINAWSALGDNVVEGTEYKDYILGIQGHPEADDKLPKIFDFLAKD